ncbi:DUF4493 domain-containing protein [uncultured Barnesiella sp.]|uniref:DUF4493 domain-containing protein n=1 Tax=uncultured Barnesiella sp. TaxID=584861 RepID=UPI002628F900|nr:DUF4493 domain-containing protein [uncultured Barnesiella sp.]
MNVKNLFLCGATVLLLVSCANEENQVDSGYGSINVKVSADYQVVPVTRSTTEITETTNPDVSEFALKLVSADGSFSRAWDSLADFDPAEKIPVGTYTMSAYYGNLEEEGFDKPYYLGQSDVAVRYRENTPVDILCTLANVKVTVEYSDAFKKYFADYATTIHAAEGDYIKFEKEETRAAYVKPGKITIQTYLKKQNGIESTFEPAAIENAQPRQHYRIKLDIADNAAGEAQLSISFDETTETQPIAIDISDEVMVAPAPSFLPAGFEPSTPLEVKENSYPDNRQVNISLTAKAGLSACTLTTSSACLESEGWPREIDLVNLSSENRALLSRLGLKLKGFTEMGSKMGFIDFAELFTHLHTLDGSDMHTFTLSAKDMYGKVSESPITLSVKSIPITFALQTPEPVFVGSKSVTIPVEFDGAYIDQVKFSYLNAEGAKINSNSTVVSSEGNLYQIKISIEATDKPVVVEGSYANGAKTSTISIPVKTPAFTITAEEYDIWARRATVKLTAEDSQYQEAVDRYAVLFANSTGQWETVASTLSQGRRIITGLNPDTRYQLRGSCNSGQDNVNYSGDLTLRTESAAAVPNGDFEEIAQTISVTDMNQGGKYSVWPVNYQNTCSFTIQEPTGWASVNAKTCNLSAANQNSWFVIPSTYNTTLTWDAYRSFGMNTVTPDLYRDLTAQSGSNAMVVRNVAWDENGTTPGTSGGAFNTTYYNTNVPNIANRSAGKLFLGSYSYSGGSETYTEGVSFASRPSALKGWYKYANDGNDPTETGVVTVTLLNGQKVIATGTARLSVAADYTEFSVPVTYSVTNQKATTLRIMITSSNHASYNQSEESAAIKTSVSNGQYESASRGATLTIDNLTFTYE